MSSTVARELHRLRVRKRAHMRTGGLHGECTCVQRIRFVCYIGNVREYCHDGTIQHMITRMRASRDTVVSLCVHTGAQSAYARIVKR